MAARLVSPTISDRSHLDCGVGDEHNVLDYLVDHNYLDSFNLHEGDDALVSIYMLVFIIIKECVHRSICEKKTSIV